MAKGYFKQIGESIDYVNSGSETIAYGDVVALTDCIGVAECDIAAGALGSLSLCGVYELPSATEALTIGQRVYWDSIGGNVTSVATDHIACGVAIAAKMAGVLVADIRIG